MTGLSKTTYKTGLNCARRLWLDRNAPELEDESLLDGTTERGHEVGELARRRFPGTVNAEERGGGGESTRLRRAAEATAELMADPACECIAEATFFHGSHKCQVDLLKRNGGGWDMIEVKSASNIREKNKTAAIRKDYLIDVAFQQWILESEGVDLRRTFLMHPDKSYRFHGELDVEAYFKAEEVTDLSAGLVPGIAANVERVAAIPAGGEPQAAPGGCCCSPKCGYLGHCLPKALEPDSLVRVGGMARKKAIEEIQAGRVTLADYIEHVEDSNAGMCTSKRKSISDGQRVVAGGEAAIDEQRLADWLAPLEGKVLYWLDFETWQLPIPRFEGDAPWAQVPTQYSLHVTHPSGRVERSEYLAKPGEDPWRPIAEALCRDIPMNATTVAYNSSFEKGRICEMAEKFPDLREHLLNIVGKAAGQNPKENKSLIDIWDPFRKRLYFLPPMGASTSIKVVLPSLFPEDASLDYHNLASCDEGAPLVQNGGMAIEAFAKTWEMDDPDLIAATRENLLRYCELDTWAMVKIWLKLREAAGFPPMPSSALQVDAPLPRIATREEKAQRTVLDYARQPKKRTSGDFRFER